MRDEVERRVELAEEHVALLVKLADAPFHEEKFDDLEKVFMDEAELRLRAHLEEKHGKPYAEIAKILGRSEGALKANYFHAVQKVKDRLRPR